MLNNRKVVAAGAVVLAASVFSNAPMVSAESGDTDLLARAKALFSPLPKYAERTDRPLNTDQIALGRALFFESRVSTDGKQSCAQCHQPMFFGTDALPMSVGNHGQQLPRNAPTVFNAALQFAQHYGGNRVDVEEQAEKALTSKLAFGNVDLAEAEARLRAIPGYRPMFERAFPGEAEPVTARNWGIAIGAYERTLLTSAPFDRYIAGDTAAIDTQAKHGLDKFISYGCAGCHNGVVLGGQMFQKFGLTQNYWELTGSTEKAAFKGRDKGRFHDTGNEADAYMFKVQQLRNVAVTPPYFHDGSVATLPQAVRIMGKLQLGRDLSDEDVSDIVAFLDTLTGSVPEQFAVLPTLPVAPYMN
jgi:cytochrome c peroxidase